MTSVSSSPNGANKPNKPWFCTNERLRWEFFSQGQKRTFHTRASEINKQQEVNRRLEDLTTAKNKKTIRTMKMKRRITRKKKNQNTKTEEDEINTIKLQIDNDGQYVELENIQLEEDLIMEGESLEPEPSLRDTPEPIMDSTDLEETPRRDTKKLKDENNSEEELQHPEENNEVVKSEEDDDIDEEEEIVTRKFTRSTRRPRVIIPPKKQQTRKSQRKTTKGSTKDWELGYEFKGRDIVFVDPLDDKAEFWWPAMIVPNDEIDESMDVDGKLEENLYAGKYLVRYFEDMTYSVVEYKGLKHFIPDAEPFLTFKDTCDRFSSHIGVRRALTCITKGEPNKAFKWDYWKRPLWENQESIPVTTTPSPSKRTRNTSKGGSKSEKSKSSVRRNSSSTKSRSSINSGNHSSQEGVPSEEEDTVNNCITSPPSSGRRRKSETENIDSQESQVSQDSQDSQSNSGTTKNNNTEMENGKINKSPKRRHSSLTDKSDEGEESSSPRSRKIKRVSTSKLMDEEPTVPSLTPPNTASAMIEEIPEIRETKIETSTENNNEQTIIDTLTEENYERIIMETPTKKTEKNNDPIIIETLIEKNNEPIETSTEDNSEPIMIETSTEKNNEPLIEIMEEDNVPSATPLTSPPLTVEELNEAAQTNISSIFKFDDPTLDAETKEKMYDEAEEKLRSLMKEWRAINRSLRKMEKELISKKARKLRNNEVLDVDIDTDDEGDAENELVDSSDNENNNEDGEEREDEEEIQVITRSKKVNEDSKVSKGKHILKKI